MAVIKNFSFLSLFFVVIFISSNITPVSAITEEGVKDFFLNTYNPAIDLVIPDIPLVKSVFAGQVMHIIIKNTDKNIELSAITNSDGYITDLETGAPDNPTLRLISNSETIEKIRNSNTPVYETEKAFESGDITYEGVGIVQSVKVAIIKILDSFLKFFFDISGLK